MKGSTAGDNRKPEVVTDAYGVRFALEMERLYGGSGLDKEQVALLRTMTAEQIVQGLEKRFDWLGPEWLERMSQKGPEAFARALAQEDARREGTPFSDDPKVPLLVEIVLRLAILFPP